MNIIEQITQDPAGLRWHIVDRRDNHSWIVGTEPDDEYIEGMNEREGWERFTAQLRPPCLNRVGSAAEPKALCDSVGCKTEVPDVQADDDERYCEFHQRQNWCSETGHCHHSDCRHHNCCCDCDADDIGYDGPESEYDTTAERDLDREIDAINDARGV